MTPTFALVSALLVSQVSLVSGATSPYSQGGSASQTIACNTNDGGCTCAAIGAVDNTSQSAVNCTGSSGAKSAIANLDNCRSNCCGDPTVATCYSAWQGRNGNQSMCGTQQPATMENDYSKFTMAAGATAAEQLTNCCKTKAIVKCSQVMCAAKGDPSDTWSATYSAIAGTADVVCTSNDDCKTKCCVRNPLMCEAQTANAHTWCGTNYTLNPTSAMSAAPECSYVPTAAATATFTFSADNASFRTACCTAKPAKTACTANFACPSPQYSGVKSPLPTTLYDSPAAWHCCDSNTNTTGCSAHATSGASCETVQFPATASTCSSAKYGCPSSKCGAGQLLDGSKYIANGATASNATIASTCCFDKPATTPAQAPSAIVPAKCSAYFVAALAGEIKAKGTSSAYLQGASLPILAVAVLMLMKF